MKKQKKKTKKIIKTFLKITIIILVLNFYAYILSEAIYKLLK